MASKLKKFMDFKHRSEPEQDPQAPSEKLASNNPYRAQQEDLPAYSPPSGPPPGHQEYSAPPGPPPGDQKYSAPPGPPPSHSANAGPSTAQPEHDPEAPPPYDPWLAVPDSTLLPPPPPMKEDWSPANNASADDAARAQQWCYYNPIWGPRTWYGPQLSQIQHHQFNLSAPPGTSMVKIGHMGRGRTSLQSARRQGDVTILSNLPLFVANPPIQPGETRMMYFQIYIKSISGPDATVAIGYLAPPYPPSRLPGWHRGSLAVHNDDGRRYVNDDGGGTDFVRPFVAGDRIGLGMRFTGSQYQGQPPTTRIFFTRNGREENSWDLHESVDQEDGGVMGLDGTTDIYAAIGVCSGVDLEVIWDEQAP